MKTTELFDSRVPTIKTSGVVISAHGFCELRVDAGFGSEDSDHSRGYVRLELDRENEQCGGIATRVLRAATVRHGGLKDVLEIHTKGDCETAALARALLFAAEQLLKTLDEDHHDGRADITDVEVYHDAPTGAGVLHDSPSGSVWQEAR